MQITKSLADWGAELNLAQQQLASAESDHAALLSSSINNPQRLENAIKRINKAWRDLQKAELCWQNASAPHQAVADGKLRGECPHCALDLGEIPDYT